MLRLLRWFYAGLFPLILVPLQAAEWQALGPFGGSAAVIQVDPHRPDTILAATSNALLFRSADGGYEWKPLPFPASLQGTLHALALDPKTPGIYFAGLSSDSAACRGVFRTRDGGATWQLLDAMRGKDVWSLAVFPIDPRVIAAGTREGIFLSRDGGEAWTRISPADNKGLQPVVSLAFDPFNSKILYAGTPHLPWKTDNGGATWRSIRAGMIDDSDVFSIEVDGKQPPKVFASACSGIYRSLNGGTTWRKLIGAKGASYRTYFVAQDPRHAGVIYAGTNRGLVRSDDGGVKWRQLSTNPTHSIAFDPYHPWRIFVATDDAGILRSNDNGKTFGGANQGFCNRYLAGLATRGGTVYIAAGGVLNIASGTGGWRAVAAPGALGREEAIRIAAAPDNPRRLYATGSRGLLVSSDGGAKWNALPSFPAKSRVAALLAQPRYVLAGTGSGLFHSDNQGKTWRRIDLGKSKPVIRSLIGLGPVAGGMIANLGVFVSKDGVSWKKTGVIPGNAEVLGLAAAGRDTLFAATSQGLIRSSNFGASWQKAGGGLDGSTVSAICADPARAGVLFAAQYGMVFESNDNGGSWSRMASRGLEAASIRELRVAAGKPGRLLALTSSQGVFELALEARASVSLTTPNNMRKVQ